MRNLWDKILKILGFEIEEVDEQSKDTVEKDYFEHKKKKSKNNVVSLPGTNGNKVIIIKLQKFETVQDISEYLKKNTAVILNLSDLDRDLAGRVLDFLSGAVYATNGKIQKVSPSIFFAAPGNFQILNADGQESDVSGINFLADNDKEVENILRR